MTSPLPEAEVVAILDGLAVMTYAHQPPWNTQGQLLIHRSAFGDLDKLPLESFRMSPWPEIVNHHISKLGRLMGATS